MQPWRLAELNYGQVKSNPPFEVAVLPLGATEPHNLHLPYGTDTFQVEAIASARLRPGCASSGPRVLLLPALPYGTETNQMKFPLAMNLNPDDASAAVITDLVDSLATHGISQVLLLNGHGGNDLKWVLRELHLSHDGPPVPVQLVQGFVRRLLDDLRGRKDDHAGEMETSMGLAHFPELVALEQADAGHVRPSRFEAVNRGWVEITRPWHLLTTNSGVGRPSGRHRRQGRGTDRIWSSSGSAASSWSSPRARSTTRSPSEPRHEPGRSRAAPVIDAMASRMQFDMFSCDFRSAA